MVAEKYTSLLALVLDRPVQDVRAVLTDAGDAIDRHSPVGDGRQAREVFWGGRMQKAVVRALQPEGRAPLLRAETYIGAEGLRAGLRRHAQLLAALAPAVSDRVVGVHDLSAGVERGLDWLARVADGDVRQDDAIIAHTEGQGTYWTHTHGAARLDIPDLELYGLHRSHTGAAVDTLRRVHSQVLEGGLQARLELADGTPLYLVPVIEAWRKLPLDWPGIARAGKPRPGHEGPRATLSVLHKRRFGRYKKDFAGVIERLD